MKKKLVSIFTCLFVALSAMAQVQPGDSQYSVSLHAGYGHNLTYGSYANFDLDAYMPINQHFDMQASVRTSTADFTTTGV